MESILINFYYESFFHFYQDLIFLTKTFPQHYINQIPVLSNAEQDYTSNWRPFYIHCTMNSLIPNKAKS